MSHVEIRSRLYSLTRNCDTISQKNTRIKRPTKSHRQGLLLDTIDLKCLHQDQASHVSSLAQGRGGPRNDVCSQYSVTTSPVRGKGRTSLKTVTPQEKLT